MPRALSQLIKSAPTLTFRHDQQRFKLMSLLLAWQASQPLPGPERSPIADVRNQPRQRGDTRQ